MIEFLQNYSTKAIPPEVFEDKQQVERSAESELYFVRLGIAAYVTDDGLVDADYRRVERVAVTVVERVDTTATLVGRGGEVPATVAAPARATTGPGNDVMFGTAPAVVALAADDVPAAPAKPGRRVVTPVADGDMADAPAA